MDSPPKSRMCVFWEKVGLSGFQIWRSSFFWGIRYTYWFVKFPGGGKLLQFLGKCLSRQRIETTIKTWKKRQAIFHCGEFQSMQLPQIWWLIFIKGAMIFDQNIKLGQKAQRGIRPPPFHWNTKKHQPDSSGRSPWHLRKTLGPTENTVCHGVSVGVIWVHQKI